MTKGPTFTPLHLQDGVSPLRQLREGANLTPQEMTAAVEKFEGYEPGALGRNWCDNRERAESRITLATLRRHAEALGLRLVVGVEEEEKKS